MSPTVRTHVNGMSMTPLAPCQVLPGLRLTCAKHVRRAVQPAEQHVVEPRIDPVHAHAELVEDGLRVQLVEVDAVLWDRQPLPAGTQTAVPHELAGVGLHYL